MSATLTYLGHSGFLITDGSQTVAIDPFLTDNPVATMKPDEVDCQAIVITHGHFDHVGDSVAIAKRTGATIYATFEIVSYMQEQEVESVQPMNTGGRVASDFGFVALTPALHSSSYEGRYMGQPCGALVNIGGSTIYHCGDTALFSDMRLLGELYRPDVACVPIGDRFTMGPDHAARAAELIGAATAIPVHYNTWPPIEQDPATFKPGGVKVQVMRPGETWTVGT